MKWPFLHRRESLIAFLLALAWFALFQPWGTFLDPDAFYHAKLTSIMIERGPVRSFPWLDLTTLGQHYADHHFFFHVALIPFVLAFGMLWGTQVGGVVFAALFITVFFLVAQWLRFSRPLFWTIVLATSTPFLFRLSLAKASPVAIALFVLGVFAVATKRRWLGFFIGGVFALSHGGWALLLGAQGLYLIGTGLFDRIVLGQTWREVVQIRHGTVFFLTCVGMLIGLFLHPNFPDNLWFLWVQVVKIGLVTPLGRVVMGDEWRSSTAGDLLAGIGPLTLVALGLVFGFIFARRSETDVARARQAIGFGFVTAALVALTLKSQRFIEYAIPVLVLFFATLSAFVDVTVFRRELLRHLQKWWLPMMGLFLLIPIQDVYDAFRQMHQNGHRFGEFSDPMNVISAQAQPGDRVFHSNWDFFPQLFALDDRLRYVVGLDPTFLLERNPMLSDVYRDVTLGLATSTAYDVIQKQFGARFVLLERADHAALERALDEDKRFTSLYVDQDAKVYRVEP